MLEYLIILFIVSGGIILVCHNYELQRKRRALARKYRSQFADNEESGKTDNKRNGARTHTINPRHKTKEVTS